MHYLNGSHDNLARYHRNTLEAWGGLETDLSLYGTMTHPGFFTPFGADRLRLLRRTERVEKMGLKEAVIALFGMPTLRLAAAVRNILLIPLHILHAVEEIIDEDKSFRDKDISNNLITAVYQIGPSIGLSFSFVFQIMKEMTALITRTIATIVSRVSRHTQSIDDNPVDDVSHLSPSNPNRPIFLDHQSLHIS